MDDLQLKQLFEKQEIPSPNDNKRKEALNLAVAAFEEKQKNEKISQGSSFWSRLIDRQPTNRRDPMSFSKKKALTGGLATACVALLVYSVSPLVNTQTTELSALTKAQMENFNSVQSVEGAAPPETASREMAEMADMAIASVAPTAAPQAMANMVMPEGRMVSRGVPGYSGSTVTFAPAPSDMITYNDQEIGRDKFSDVEQHAIKQVKEDPVSTFSIDVDTASYSFVRSNLDNGTLPQKDAVRVEELINYFDYAYPLPTNKDEPFKASIAIKPSPWHEGRKLMAIGIKGFDVKKAEAPDSNLVFLLDVSGSMAQPNRLPLLKQSLTMLLDTLKPTDKVSIVVYAGAAGMVLPPTEVANKAAILMALQNLQPGGSTAGAEGIRLAYQLAESNFKKDAVNRVILATDGDFNVGITDPNELQDFIERKRESGVFLSVLGFGRGNYNDDMMQRLAQNGNGVAAYIDNLNEARKVLVEEAGATLFPIAKDVKIQVEFNPAAVSEYRLVGYETRALKTEDFNNDKVDAGDIGAGAEVTAIYEITPVGAAKAVDDSRYAAKAEVAGDSNEYGFLKIRYKLPAEDKSKLITTPVTTAQETIDPVLARETDWAVAVATFGQMLKGGTYTGSMTYDDVLKLAQASKGDDPFGYRAEFITLIYKAKTAAAMQSQGGMPYQGVPGQPVPIPVPMPMPMQER
jgi:Ca-activated chloride channel family protein